MFITVEKCFLGVKNLNSLQVAVIIDDQLKNVFGWKNLNSLQVVVVIDYHPQMTKGVSEKKIYVCMPMHLKIDFCLHANAFENNQSDMKEPSFFT